MRNLGVVALLNAVLLPAVVLRLTGPTVGSIAAWVVIDVLLVVGAGYWFARAARARDGLACTPHLHAFARIRPALLAVLGATAVIVAVDLVTEPSGRASQLPCSGRSPWPST